jgi:hypothetical protein
MLSTSAGLAAAWVDRMRAAVHLVQCKSSILGGPTSVGELDTDRIAVAQSSPA